MIHAMVRSRKQLADGKPVGKANPNPILDPRMYNVKYTDGLTAELAANVITQNMNAICNTEGNQGLVLLDGIVVLSKMSLLWNS